LDYSSDEPRQRIGNLRRIFRLVRPEEQWANANHLDRRPSEWGFNVGPVRGNRRMRHRRCREPEWPRRPYRRRRQAHVTRSQHIRLERRAHRQRGHRGVPGVSRALLRVDQSGFIRITWATGPAWNAVEIERSAQEACKAAIRPQSGS